MPKGTVKWFNPTKVLVLSNLKRGKRRLRSRSAVERAGLQGLREGQKVEFELVPSRDGRNAADNLVALD